MSIKSIVMGAAAAGLVATPIAVSANAAERTAAPAEGEQGLVGSGLIIAGLAAAAVIAGIIIIADDDDDDAVSA
ncbi:hypothetical protein [Qipengyuania sp.]|uniref:hypothetical protein n=1 Tax=Qipengyuania sp. TaxID=2004515 RepID=UPI0035C7E4E4